MRPIPKTISAPDAARAAARPLPGEVPEGASLSETLRQVDALRSPPSGRNDPDALPPAAESVSHARAWLESQWQQCRSEGVRWYMPNVTASAEGGVVFEWWAEDRSVIVYVEDDAAEFHSSQDGSGSTQHTHGEAPLGQVQVDLMLWFGGRCHAVSARTLKKSGH